MKKPAEPLARFYAYDYDDIYLYAHARGYSIIYSDVKEKLRSDLKYKNYPDEVQKYIEEFRAFMNDERDSYHLAEE